MQGLIVENKANLYKIKLGDINYIATARGKFKNDSFTPVVGDIAEFSIVDENKKTAVIESVKERVSYIKRPKLANINQIVFVVSSKHPKPDLLLLDKQLAFAEFLHIKPVIVLNKIDLDDKHEFLNIQKIYEEIGYKVIQTDAKNGIGIEEILLELKNNISAFAGNSGVGKSTLINDLFKENVTQEGEISQKNKRGKNTTTDIRLYELDTDTYIADTPGFSTFDVYEIPYRELDKYFREFKNCIDKCRYIGCSHIKEDECGIKLELEQGKIAKSRYDNYVKIYSELKDKEEQMVDISTSLLSVKKEKIIDTVYKLEDANTNYFHIDVMDGEFVENDTHDIMLEYCEYLNNITKIPLDIHLMVKDVKNFVDSYLIFNPNIITFHCEACKNKEEVMNLINYIKEKGRRVGISIKPETDVKEILEFLPYVHVVLVMTVEPGKGGQELILPTIEKIKELNSYREEHKLDYEIEADGGIKVENSEKIIDAGADILVAGTAIINSKDYAETIKKLK